MNTLSTDRIPVIDFAGWRRGPDERAALAEAVGRAAEVYGFMLIRGHGIDPAVLAATFDAGHRFFEQPDDVKAQVQDRRRSDRGWQPMFDNLREDGKPSAQEGYTMSHPVAPTDSALAALSFHALTPWPALPGFREALERLYADLFVLGRDLLDAMAMHLRAPAGFFEPGLADTYSHLRINHYPPQESVDHIAEEGVFAHFDESLLTLLLQDENSGLQVMGRDGLWIPVDPDPTAVVVNVGKMLRHWTGGRYNAALHQVINRSGRDRYSIPLFLHPGFHTRVDPADLLGEPDPAWPPVIAGEQVFASFAATRKSWREDDS